MRILYIATSFPSPNKGATIYTDLAEALSQAGHDITVVVSEYERTSIKTKIRKERGFEVLRIVTGRYYDVNLIEKGITTLRIPFLMKRGISKHLGNKEFDFILFESPPVTNADLIIWAKERFKCPSYLMLKDIFPQNAIDLYIIRKNGLIHKFFLSKEELLYKSADIIGCMSEANRKYILEHNPSISESKVEIFPNTKRITNDYLVNNFPLRTKYAIPENACVFFLGGNMGKPQYVDLLCKAITDCKEEKNIFFLFVGRGTERNKIDNTIKQEKIKNVLTIDNLPRDEYEQLTKECDVGLIVLDPRFTIPNFPSRILTYMEYAKPVLAATDKTTDIKDLIENSKCGTWVWSGDTEAFIHEIRRLASSPSIQDVGKNGRVYIVKNLHISKSVEILEKHFI